MKIVYVHHAERDLNHIDPSDHSKDVITKSGAKEADMVGKLLSKYKYTCIYTSSYKRCTMTAEIINKYLNVPIYVMDEFDEWRKGEVKKEFLKRNMKGIKKIVDNHDPDDKVICITSGVNLTAFVCYFYNVKLHNGLPLVQGAAMSPVNFYTREGECD